MKLIEKLKLAHAGNYNDMQEIRDTVDLSKYFGGSRNDLYPIASAYYVDKLSIEGLECVYGLSYDDIVLMLSKATRRILVAEQHFRVEKAYKEITEECFAAELESEDDEYIF